ncbi:MAG: putative ABC transporter permease subunit [Planctomycetota bacterium]|jgi:ABC-2 type transport system permease protein
MTALGVILRYRARTAWNRIRGLRNESLLKTLVVAAVGGGLWAALFAGSVKSLWFLRRFPDLREDIIYTTVALLFLTLTVLLIFSSAILSFGSLFRNAEARLLLASPVPAGSVYAYKTVDGLVFSSWAFFVMGLPPLVAYGMDVGAPAVYYAGLLLFFVPFTIMTAAVGTLMGFAITALVPRRRGVLLGLVIGAAIIAAALIAFRLLGARREGLAFGELWKERILGHLSFLRSRFLPHTWLTRGILLLAAGKLADVVVDWTAMASSAAFACLLGDFVARRTYARAYSSAAAGSPSRNYRRAAVARAAEFLARPAGRISALFVSKDVRLFLRDPAQWSQVAIFFGLLGVYVLNLRSLQYDLSKGFWQHLVSTLNLAAACLTLGTLTTRFVFPQISLEGRRFWVLGLAPAKRRDILLGKFVVYLGGTLLVAETLVVLSNVMLRMPRGVFVVQTATAALVCVGLTGLAVGLGAIYPNYRETNPGRIVSGFGGTLTLVLSAVFVFTMVAIVTVPAQMRLVDATLGPRGYVRWAAGSMVLACLATALAAGLPLYYGARSLERAEF